MSGSQYRFENAKFGRAGCQNSKCKHEGIKIQKGEFRMGSLVFIRDNASFMWKHWGCVTPAQIKNLQDQVGPLEDLDLDADLPVIIDGYDEIRPEDQEKIKFALQHGHVADEDWKGEPELNRPGMKGINKRTPKKKPAEDEDTTEEHADTPSKPKAKKGRTKKTKMESDTEDGLSDSPPPKKRAATKRKVKVEDQDDEVDPVPTKKAKPRQRKADVKREEDDVDTEVPVEAPIKKSRAKKVKQEVDEDNDVDEGVPMEAPIKKSRAKKIKQEVDEDNNVDPEVPMEAPIKRSRAKKVKQEVDEEDDVGPPPPPHSKRSRTKKVKAEEQEQDEEGIAPPAEEAPTKTKLSSRGRTTKASKKEGPITEADKMAEIPVHEEAEGGPDMMAKATGQNSNIKAEEEEHEGPALADAGIQDGLAEGERGTGADEAGEDNGEEIKPTKGTGRKRGGRKTAKGRAK